MIGFILLGVYLLCYVLSVPVITDLGSLEIDVSNHSNVSVPDSWYSKTISYTVTTSLVNCPILPVIWKTMDFYLDKYIGLPYK